MLVDPKILRHFGEQKYYNGFVSQREIDGKVEMTFLTSSIEGFARWFMMFGDQAEVVSPDNLKMRVKEIASKIASRN